MSRNTASVLEELDHAECMRLVAGQNVGRLAYVGRYDLTILPVNYRVAGGVILFRTAEDSRTGEDLRTGIANADYRVAFEVDQLDETAREGWSVLIQGPAHHLDSVADRAAAQQAEVEPWPRGEKEHFIRITPERVTGRRIRRGLAAST